MKSTLLLGLAIAAAAAYGCYTGPELGTGSEPPPAGSTPDAEAPSAPSVHGLPCEVAELMTKECVSCHGATPTRGAKTTLTTREALMANWEDGRPLAVVSLERMRDEVNPMPPSALLPTAEVDVFARWVEAGMPEGSCEQPAPPPSKPAALHCTSGRFWDEGDDEGDERMTPGQACITCHEKERKEEDDKDEDDDDLPRFTAAGTVYPTLYEPDDCFGLGDPTAVVILEGADGARQELPVNRSGNFMTERPLALPYRASVVRNGKTRAMQTEQTNGDCNHCHSENAVDAPGRIMAP